MMVKLKHPRMQKEQRFKMYSLMKDKIELATIIGETPRVGDSVELDGVNREVIKVTYVVKLNIQEEILVYVSSPGRLPPLIPL